jgi:hypothetical protein
MRVYRKIVTSIDNQAELNKIQNEYLPVGSVIDKNSTMETMITIHYTVDDHKFLVSAIPNFLEYITIAVYDASNDSQTTDPSTLSDIKNLFYECLTARYGFENFNS